MAGDRIGSDGRRRRVRGSAAAHGGGRGAAAQRPAVRGLKVVHPPRGDGTAMATATFAIELHIGGADDDGSPWHGDGDDDTGVDDDENGGGGGSAFGAVPASGVAVGALPETTVSDAGERTEKQCAVCLEGYATGDALRTMPCSHGFHERCIFGWLLVSRLCPLCRIALPSEAETSPEMLDEADDDGGSETFASPSLSSTD
ncbi:hypothetical protein ACP4OV_014502 [Aristida adscensionis]